MKMKKIKCLLVLLSVLLLCSCSTTPNNQVSEGSAQSESTPIADATQNTNEPEPQIESEPIPEELLPLQGEWKQEKSDWHLVVNGDQAVLAYYETITDTIEEGNYKHYTLVVNADGEVITKTYFEDDRQEKLSLNSADQIELSNNKNETVNIYEKVSDNTTLPVAIHRDDPKIGMTKDEVQESTWGNPKKINKLTTGNSVTEQWVYDNGYIYFTDGYVTAIQN